MSILLAALTLVEIGSSWDIQLSEPFVLDRPVTMLILYPGNHDASELARLKEANVQVLCYVSIGTVEDWLDDAGTFPKKAVGKALPYGASERYVDYRRRDVLVPIMEKRFKACKAAGYDGIYPDNLDAFKNDSGFDLSAEDAVSYVRELAEVAHGLGLIIGQVNAPDLAEALSSDLDVAVATSCWESEFCEAYLAYTHAGKPIYDIEYAESGIVFDKACEDARKLGISMILKDWDLTGKVYESCD